MEGDWSDGISISDNINSAFNEGAPTFSSDGQYIIFVGCETGAKGDYEYGSGRKGYGSCDLFYSQKIGKKWSSLLIRSTHQYKTLGNTTFFFIGW